MLNVINIALVNLSVLIWNCAVLLFQEPERLVDYIITILIFPAFPSARKYLLRGMLVGWVLGTGCLSDLPWHETLKTSAIYTNCKLKVITKIAICDLQIRNYQNHNNSTWLILFSIAAFPGRTCCLQKNHAAQPPKRSKKSNTFNSRFYEWSSESWKLATSAAIQETLLGS